MRKPALALALLVGSLLTLAAASVAKDATRVEVQAPAPVAKAAPQTVVNPHLAPGFVWASACTDYCSAGQAACVQNCPPQGVHGHVLCVANCQLAWEDCFKSCT